MMAHVADYADDAKPRARAAAEHEAQPAAERVATRPEPAGHGLVNYHDAIGRIGAIPGNKRAAGTERDAQRAEISVGDDAAVHGDRAFRLRLPLDLDADEHVRPSKRKTVDGCGSRHAWQRLDTI